MFNPNYTDSITEAVKKALHPNQKKLDVDKDGDIEADDLKDLRSKKVNEDEKIVEKYDADDEADTMFKYDHTRGKLVSKTVTHSQRKDHVAAGWKDSHESAMKAHGYTKSKFKAGHYVKKNGDKWDSVNPYKAESVEIEEEKKKSKDDPCWKGYVQLGMKEKDGKKVPNCVPEATEGKCSCSKCVKEEMTDTQMSKREKIIKGLKKSKADFVKRYGKDAESVMYATATKNAMKEDNENV